MRHAHPLPGARGARSGPPEGGHVRRSERVRRAADGDLHDRQAGVPSRTRGRTRLRARPGLTGGDIGLPGGEPPRSWGRRAVTKLSYAVLLLLGFVISPGPAGAQTAIGSVPTVYRLNAE